MEPSQLLAIGGVWLDEIRLPGKPALENVLGGSVTFATLGARLFTPPTSTQPIRRSRMIFAAGHDFPPDVLQLLRQWEIDVTVHWRLDEVSARGIVHYEDDKDGSKRSYERTTAPLLYHWDRLPLSDILRPTSFHFFDTPECKSYIHAILDLRGVFANAVRPLIIWEPQAKSCSPENLDDHFETARYVDVFSPNHMELHSFFDRNPPDTFSKTTIEDQARRFVASGIGPQSQGSVIVRAAEHGCLVLLPEKPALWLPAFYPPESPKVVDPTGAGNAFLGALSVGYHETGSFVEAAKYGAVAASCVIEQFGFPVVAGKGLEETWNEENVRQRLRVYQDMCESRDDWT